MLKADYDCLVFHATGTGGRAMEKLVDSGLLAGVIDVTTTEIADLHRAAACSAPAKTGSARSPARASPTSARSARSTWSISGPPETVPEKYREPQALPPQSAGDADADDGRREPRASGAWIAERSTAARARCGS